VKSIVVPASNAGPVHYSDARGLLSALSAVGVVAEAAVVVVAVEACFAQLGVR
jgi:hypothetical protein